jgi:hypothetical protein
MVGMPDTAAERARYEAEQFAARWIAASLDITPLTQTDRSRVVDGIHEVCRATGRRRPDLVLWVEDPDELTARADSPNPLIARWAQDEDRRRLYRESAWMSRAPLKSFTRLAIHLRKRRSRVLRRRQLAAEASKFNDFVSPTSALTLWREWPDYPLALSHRDLETIREQDVPDPFRMPYEYEVWLKIYSRVAEALREVWLPIMPDYRAGTMTRGHLSFDWPTWIWKVGREPIGSPDPRRELRAGLLKTERAVGWTIYSGLALICGPPLELHLERVGGRYRLHNASGPAVVWGGSAKRSEYHVHGVRLPERFPQRR